MRLSPFLIAASLAFATLTSHAALAFDVQTLSGSNADGSSKYADPDDQFERQPLTGINGTGLSVTPSMQFGLGRGTPVQSFSGRGADNSWQHLAPTGRLTH